MNLESIYRDLLQKREEKFEYSGTIKGTCQEYCPYFEYIERTLRGDINKYEKHILIKKYNRSSAGKNKPFPEDCRPLSVLSAVFDYLLQFCDYSLESYKFLENRTRAIRLDISIQELECDRTINILEKICRLLIIYSYVLYDNKEFEDHLNLEQIKKILGTLLEMYKKRGFYNEEFITYYKCITFNINSITFNSTNFKCNTFDIKNINNTNNNNITNYNNNNINNYNISLIDDIKLAYCQNNFYKFFKLSRKLDFLTYCLCHTYFDKCRLKGIEIYSKCFIEKIDSRIIKKNLYLTNEELMSLCKKTNITLFINNNMNNINDHSMNVNYNNISINDYNNNMNDSNDYNINNNNINDSNEIIIDFKNKNLFENENVLFKERKVLIIPNKFIILGNIDFTILKFIIKLWTIKYFINVSYKTPPLEIKRKKTKFNIFKNKKETENDIYNIIIKIYSKISSIIFCRDIKKRILVFDKKRKMAKEMCLFILNLYISNIINRNKKINIEIPVLNNILCFITDDSIFSAIFINNIKKSILIKYNPVFLQYKNININLLLKYRVSVFAINKKYIIDINNKYYMINKLIDIPQNMSKKIKEIDDVIFNSKKIIKNKLDNLLEKKSRIKQISILTYLINNGRNPDIKEEWIERIDKRGQLENIEVYYEEGSYMY